jgi:ligand-binding sensor domain-containing protein/two-component sensor histidine kinase
MGTKSAIAILFLLHVVVPYRLVWAQSQVLDVVGIHYDVRNGLIDNNVTDGLIDQRGGLWLVTTRGLSYFDGHRFINFSSQDSVNTLRSNRIRAVSHSDGRIYVAADSTIDVIDIASKMVTSHPYIHRNGPIRDLINGSDGKLFVIDDSGDLIDIDSQKSLNIGFSGLDYYYALLEDQKTVLVTNAKSTHITKIDLASFNVLVTWDKSRMPRERTYGLVISKSHGVLNLLNSGVSAVDIGNGLETSVPLGSEVITHYDRHLTDYEMLVIGFDTISLIDRAGNLVPLKMVNSRITNYKKMLTDGKRTVFALHDRGVTVFRVPPDFLTTLPLNRMERYEPNVLYKSMLELPDKEILIFSYGGILKYEPSSNSVEMMTEGSVNLVSGMVSNRSLYVASDGMGLLEFDGSTYSLKKRHQIDFTIEFERAYTIYKEIDGDLIIGYASPLGIWRFSPKSQRFVQIPIQFKDSDTINKAVNDLTRDDRGHYWIASNQGLYHLDNNWETKRIYSHLGSNAATKISTSKINQVLITSDRNLWVATDNGLYSKDPDQDQLVHIPQFTGTVIASVEEDQYGRLWIATYLGLVVYDPKTQKINRFYQEDGFIDNEYNIGSHLKTSDGLIYFGGLNGIIQVNPSKWILDDDESAMQISSVTVERGNGTELVNVHASETQPIRIDGSEDLLTVMVSFMNFVNPTYSTYRYRLAGLKGMWLNLENGTLRLRNLPVGEYFIEIEGTQASGPSINEPVRIPVLVTQPFVRSVYFPVIVSLVILILIITVIYNNYSQKIALRTIKKNMLNDIQDELGGLLAKAAMKTELIRPEEVVKGDDLLEIQNLFREGVQSLRNLLWSISSETSTTLEFQDRITDWLGFVFRGTPFEFSFRNDIPKMQFNLSIQQRRQLLTIIKELAVNSIRHSGGDHFQIELDRQRNKFRLIISDNGQNEDGEIINSGYGLMGIRNRVATLGGTVHFTKNITGFKTTIEF